MMDELSLMEENGKEVTQEQKERVYGLVKDLQCSNAALLSENDLFERFISLLDPQDLGCQAVGEGLGTAGAPQLEGGARGRRQRSQSDDLLQLTLAQKLFIAQNLVTKTRQDNEKLKQRYETIQDNYKASLSETESRRAEIRRARNKFEHEQLKLKKNSSDMTVPDKVLKDIIGKLKPPQLENFKLKNLTLQAQERKLQQQLQQGREMKKADYEVSFQEYKPCLPEDINEVRVNSLKVQRALTSHQEMLQNVTQECTELTKDIAKRRQMLEKIEEEIPRAEEERLKAEALNKHMRRQMSDYQAPAILDYIHVKAKHKQLQQNIHIWERKVGVAEMSLKTHIKTRNIQGATVNPANSAEAGARGGEQRSPVKLPDIAEHDTQREVENPNTHLES